MSINSSKKSYISHILGIDYGKSKVGLAIGDSETRIAFQYGTLNNDKNLLQKIAEIIEKENIQKIIIGASLASRVSRLNITDAEVKSLRLKSDRPWQFGNQVSKLLKVKVEYQDEMFTTQQARRNLIEKGVKGTKKYDDQEAARIILQSWLDRQVKI